MNQVKTVLLLGMLTGILVAAGYYFGGRNGALVALVLAILFNFVSYWFSDRIVLRMYKGKEITKEQDPDLHRMVEELSLQHQIEKPRVFRIDMESPNAFATGRNEKRAVIAVSDSLKELLSEEELRGVISHELSHIRNKDMLVGTLAATLAGAISYLAQIAYYTGGIFGGSDDDDRGGIVGMLAFVILTPIMALLIRLAISRSREYLADETAVKATKNPSGLANALIKIHEIAKRAPLPVQPKNEATAHLFIAILLGSLCFLRYFRRIRLWRRELGGLKK